MSEPGPSQTLRPQTAGPLSEVDLPGNDDLTPDVCATAFGSAGRSGRVSGFAPGRPGLELIDIVERFKLSGMPPAEWRVIPPTAAQRRFGPQFGLDKIVLL